MSEVDMPASFYLKNLQYRALPFAKKACANCPIESGFYLPYAEDLLLKIQNKDIQIEVAKRWFCHCNITKACRGLTNWMGFHNELGPIPKRSKEPCRAPDQKRSRRV